jgi:hypothetical protein
LGAASKHTRCTPPDTAAVLAMPCRAVLCLCRSACAGPAAGQAARVQNAHGEGARTQGVHAVCMYMCVCVCVCVRKHSTAMHKCGHRPCSCPAAPHHRTATSPCPATSWSAETRRRQPRQVRCACAGHAALHART